ncbi:protein FAM187B-like [Huso huso]|uniref:Protein FAM187B-like n=1 Tax=Huso huso TaxID=61971 RepID=A0ABR0YBY3_HUSHU
MDNYATVFVCLVLTGTLGVGASMEIPLACGADWPCLLALATSSPASLVCPNASEYSDVFWQYQNLSSRNHSLPETIATLKGIDEKLDDPFLVDLQSRVQIILEELVIKAARVEDSGVYLCQRRNKTLAHYEVDFQDATDLHVSHADLEQETLKNVTVDLENGTQAEIFTLWGDWQPCDRCGGTGERKKVGFCYVRMVPAPTGMEETAPCGLMKLKLGGLLRNASFGRGPEIRIQTCYENCSDDIEETLESLELLSMAIVKPYETSVYSTATLNCPSASIYSPIYWERDSCSLTHLGLLLHNGSHSVDSGGGTYLIRNVSSADTGLYRCFVNRQLSDSFNVRIRDPWNAGPRRVLEGAVRAFEFCALLAFLFSLLYTVAWVTKRVQKRPVSRAGDQYPGPGSRM